jgi:hypothetical protein
MYRRFDGEPRVRCDMTRKVVILGTLAFVLASWAGIGFAIWLCLTYGE